MFTVEQRERGEGQGAGGTGERRRARAGTGGPLCHLPHSLRASGRHTKAHDDFLPSFLSLAITVVTVADTVRVRVTAIQYFGVRPGRARRQLLQELGDNPVHSDQGQGYLKR